MPRRPHRANDKPGRVAATKLINRWVDTQGTLHEANVEATVVGETESGRAYEPTCDEVAMRCWCERSSVWVPQSFVRAGKTLSCGTRPCLELSPDGEVGERATEKQKGQR